MGYDCIRIDRNRSGGFTVRATDPEIAKANRMRHTKNEAVPVDDWKDPEVSYEFSKKEQVLEFLDKAMNIALPPDEFSSVFDKLAREVKEDD